MRGKEGNGEKRGKKKERKKKEKRIESLDHHTHDRRGGKKYGRVDEDYVTVTDRLY